MQTFDVNQIRNDFPTLTQRVYENPLVYLDNGATAQKPQAVIDAITDFYTTYNSNVHRGVHSLSQKATNQYEKVRGLVKTFINAQHEEEIIFTSGTTHAFNLIANSFAKAFLNPGDEVLISEMEHHANIVPWQLIQQQYGINLKVIPVTPSGELNLEAYENLLTERTQIVSIAHVSNTLGTVNPVRKVIEKAHLKGSLVILDGAQAIPHQRLDVQALGADFYCFSGHKLFAPTGTGVLYGKKKWLDQMPPFFGGGDMIKEVTFEKTTFNDLPHKFEAGTPNISGIIGLGAAIEYLNKLDMNLIQLYDFTLAKYAREKLEAIEELDFLGTAPDKIGTFSFNIKGMHAFDVGLVLDRMGIATRTGHHCTQPLHHKFGVSSTVRASFAFYNTFEEVDYLENALKKLIQKQSSKGLGYPSNDALPHPPTDKPKSIEAIEAEIVEEFNLVNELFESPEEIIENYIWEQAKTLPPLAEKYKSETYRVNGCASNVWLHGAFKEQRLYFEADSDAETPRGIIALLLRVLSGQTAEAIIKAPLTFIDKIGLRSLISPNRSNGLSAMIKQIKLYAVALQSNILDDE